MDLNAVTGADVNGFSTDLGSVTKCYYLNGSTHTFAGAVCLYDYKAGTSGAEKKTHEEMQELELSGFGKVAETKNYPNTVVEDGTEAAYPYPGSVSGLGGTVHYGDWPTSADMGTVGMIYWELEEGGANSGYHFSYIGFDAKGVRKAGSRLCTAHDDGGKIAAYGYGYYQKKDTGEVMLAATMKNGTFRLGDEKTDVADALTKQVSGYTFTCYQTDEEGLRLQSSDDANGTWTLTQNEKTHTYAVCPFFGDSYCPVGEVGDAQNLGKKDAKKQYQIRSVDQLQFINWSYSSGSTGSVDRKVTESTYKTFPYLQYNTTKYRLGILEEPQKRGPAEEKRPQRSWTQTHDVNGVDMENPTDGAQNTLFHPIAGAVVQHEGYNVTLYAWFGGQYNGGNYYIKNIAIDSYCYNVGVFGTTAGATIKNIVLYSDNGGIIQRSSNVTGSREGAEESRYQCAYALGGLAGIAYEYADERGANGAVIQNCAIAGYEIQDNSKNKLGLGEAVVGGLVGVSSLELDRCSAVVDIAINCTHLNEKGELAAPQWGNFVRVGGLVGGVRGKVSNCYTGGKIEVSEDTLKERVKDKKLKELVGLNETKVEVVQGNNSWDNNPATFVYLGGIGGSGFSSTFKNFGASQDGNPNFENCYTYMTFPKMQGTITGISLIGSVADRYGQADSMTITNCYYLDSSANIDFTQLPKFYASGKKSLTDLLGGDSTEAKTKRDNMLKGKLDYLGQYTWDSAKTDIYHINGLTPLTYEQMSNQDGQNNLIQTQNGSTAAYKTFLDALNRNGKAFGWVTNVENGSTIHGKYSFPGSDAALQGQDYPFPTVLQGTDSTGATVNLHYGAWPKVGMLWNEGIVSLDLIADYVPPSGATKELELNLLNVPKGTDPTALPTFKYSPEGVVTASATRIETGDHVGDFAVTLKGEGTGAAEVIAKYGDYTARLMVTVTADLKVNLEAESVELNAGSEKIVQLTAVDKKNQAHPATWTVTSDDLAVAEVTEPVGDEITVTGVAAGETQLRITATCKVGGKDYTATAILPVTVKEISGGG